jgi:hypothetical protein
VTNKTFQEFNARKYQIPACHHVKIILAEIQENIIEFYHIKIVVRGILEGFLLLDFLKQFFPAREYCFCPDVFLYVSKGRGLDEGILGCFLDDRIWLCSEFHCIATIREETFPASGSCIFGTLGDFLVVGFFGGISPVTKNDALDMCTK